MKKLLVSFLLLIFSNISLADTSVEIVPTSTLKGPQGSVASTVVELSKSAGFQIKATQKNGCGEAVSYFENAKDPVAIIWSSTMFKNSKESKQNCIINFEKATPVAVTFSSYDLCVLNGRKLESGKTYKLGNNKFNPQKTQLEEFNKNRYKIKFENVTYASSGAAVQGLLNKEVDIVYSATPNAVSAIKAGSIKCLYSTGSSKYGQQPMSKFIENSPLNDFSLGMMVFVKNLSAKQINDLQKSLQKGFAKQMANKELINSKVAPSKTDVNKFIATAKIYETYN